MNGTATPLLAPLAGRFFLSLIFIVSGLGKLTSYGATVAYMDTHGLPMAGLLFVFALLIEIAGGGLLLIGFQARLAALALIVFTIVATLFFHDFWTYAGPERTAQFGHFMKNLAMIGGLLLVIGFGAGPYSLDNKKATRY